MPNEILNIQHTITQLQNVEKVQVIGLLREAGVVSFDALLIGKMVSLSIKAEDKGFHETMKAALPEFSERLAGYGMRLSILRGQV